MTSEAVERMACRHCDSLLTSREYAKDHLVDYHEIDEDEAKRAVDRVDWKRQKERGRHD